MQLFIQLAINAISLGGVYAIIALGFALVFGVLKFSNWSHGGVIMVSAYAGYFAAGVLKLPFVPALLAAMLAGGALSVLIEKIAIRPIRVKKGPAIYFFVTSITMSLLLSNLVQATIGYTFYIYPPMLAKSSMTIGGATISTLNLIILATVILSIVALSFILKRTRIGIAIRAASNDLGAAGLMGIDIDTIISITFFMAGALAGIAGFFAGISYTVYPQMSELMVKGFVAAVIGGLGSMPGAIYGALLLGILETLVTVFSSSSLSPIVSLVVLFVLLIFRPRGIAGIIVPDKV
jgi:branched-chain amino acid transport system permease protein